jgi:hypothetical protein
MGCGGGGAPHPAAGESAGSPLPATAPATAGRWGALVASEDLLLAITPRLDALDRAVFEGSLPGPAAADLFAPVVTWTDIAAEPPPSETAHLEFPGVSERSWPTAKHAHEIPTREAGLWLPALLATPPSEGFQHAHFKIAKAKFLDESRSSWETEIRFAGLAGSGSGGLLALSSSQRVLWRRAADAPPADAASWSIVEWETKSFKTMAAPGALFEEVLGRMLDGDALARARRSLHEERIVAWMRDPATELPPYFELEAFDQHPGLAVSDLDGDGWDEIYVMERLGKNQLLRRGSGGAWQDVAPALGLDVDGGCSSALFADFDNDGDKDAIVGRTLLPSLFFRNVDGHFVDESATVFGGPGPRLVSSLAAADADLDGYLDVYVSTYAASRMEKEWDRLGRSGQLGAPAFGELLSPEESVELGRRMAAPEAHYYVNRPGPPNRMLWNSGGQRFETRERGAALAVYRNTYQATWGDYDGDRDPDLYLANDFGPHNLFRNDGEAGFSDVTAQTGTEDVGFGMGASWGDYDGDLRQDLYVTNMFSKAGQRITGAIDSIDPRMKKAASGNSLFRNLVDSFEKVSGTSPPALLVEAGGWGWGGQFADFDRDGRLDLHSISGYYTAPAEVAIAVDC